MARETAFRLFTIVLFLAAAVAVGFGVKFWMDADAVVARSAQTGALQVSANPRLTTLERTVAIDRFAQTWAMSAIPCRTAFLLWTDLTASEATLPAMPVSQSLAAALVPGPRGTSVRGRLQRFVVACQLEQRFPDAALLRAWLFGASFGQGLSGAEAAAQAVFGKTAGALNAEEAARLTALLRAPGLRSQPERWAERAQAVSERVAAYPR